MNRSANAAAQTPLDQAFALLAAGRLPEAEGRFWQVLRAEPSNHRAMHALAQLGCHFGQNEAALGLAEQAVALQNRDAQYHNTLGRIRKGLGRLKEAEASYRRAIKLHPEFAEARVSLGIVLKNQGRLDEAIACYQAALRLRPGYPEAKVNLANALRESGSADAAASLYSEAAAAAPELAEAQSAQAASLLSQGRHDEALENYRRALELNPEQPRLQFLMGWLLDERGSRAEALEAYRRAVELKPDYADAHVNLGLALRESGRSQEALDTFRRAIEVEPDHVEAHVNYAVCLGELTMHKAAETILRRALELRPGNATVAMNLGVSLIQSNKLHEAEQHLRAALAAEPEAAQIRANLAMALQGPGRHREAIELLRRATELQPDLGLAHDNLLLALCYAEGVSPEEIVAAARHFGQCLSPANDLLAPPANTPDGARRLKIGFLSPDLRDHSVSYFLEPLLAHRDRARFEVYCYYNNTVEDAISQRLRDSADHWLQCHGVPDDALAAKIRADGIDILIELAGHTAHHRLATFALRPAPVQMTWLGYPATVGLPAIGWRISDNRVDPEGSERYNTERLLRLPHSYFCYRPPADAPAIGPLPAERNGSVTFGSFNNLPKLTAATLDLWAAVMKACPEARLLVKTRALGDDGTRERFAAALAERGVAAERYDLLAWAEGNASHLDIYNRVDIALDSFPYNGATTTCEALWMGVPVVSLHSATQASRMGLSLLSAVGLDELCAATPDDYVGIATALAGDAERLRRYRHGMRDRLRGSSLMDETGFARDMEAAWRTAWQDWCDARTGLAAPPDPDPRSAPVPADDPYGAALALRVSPIGLDALAVQLGAQRATLRPQLPGLLDAFAQQPASPDLLNDLGLALAQSGFLGEAIEAYQRAILGDGGHVPAHANLANALRKLNRPGEAEACYIRALTLRPSHPQATLGLAALLREQGGMQEAKVLLRDSLSFQTDPYLRGQTLSHLGITLQGPVHGEESLDLLRQAAVTDPRAVGVRDTLLMGLCYAEGITAAELRNAAADFDRDFCAALRPDRAEHANVLDPERPLRIGYVSQDFVGHSVASFIEPVLARHNPAKFETYCYFNNTVADPVSQRLQGLARHWLPCAGASDEALAEKIRADGIDILVDLAGHTAGHRLLTFARKPAPLQMTWLGFPVTTGLSAIDYRITDAQADPESDTAWNAEMPLRLPHSYFCYRPEFAPAVGAPPCLGNGYVTFGSFNNLPKLRRATVERWAAILAAVPGSRLLLKAWQLRDANTAQEVVACFAAAGVARERLELVGWMADSIEHLALYRRVDIALDTFPYNGATTTCEALWMGVPVVSLAGDIPCSRMGQSILHAAGLNELITHSAPEYFDTAVALADAPTRLAELREGLRRRLLASPLMDEVGFTRDLETLYREAWRRYCGVVA